MQRAPYFRNNFKFEYRRVRCGNGTSQEPGNGFSYLLELRYTNLAPARPYTINRALIYLHAISREIYAERRLRQLRWDFLSW